MCESVKRLCTNVFVRQIFLVVENKRRKHSRLLAVVDSKIDFRLFVFLPTGPKSFRSSLVCRCRCKWQFIHTHVRWLTRWRQTFYRISISECQSMKYLHNQCRNATKNSWEFDGISCANMENSIHFFCLNISYFFSDFIDFTRSHRRSIEMSFARLSLIKIHWRIHCKPCTLHWPRLNWIIKIYCSFFIPCPILWILGLRKHFSNSLSLK